MTPEQLAAMWERAAEHAPERAHRIGIEEYAHEAKRDRLALLHYVDGLHKALAAVEMAKYVAPELRHLDIRSLEEFLAGDPESRRVMAEATVDDEDATPGQRAAARAILDGAE